MKRMIMFLLPLFVCFSLLTLDVSATMYIAGLETLPVSEEKEKKWIEATNMSLVTVEPVKQAIACFDVSSEGAIAVGFDSNPRKVCIYDSDGAFLYGYSFHCKGTYGIAFVNKNLAVYFVRGSIIEVYDPSGQCVGVYSIPDTDNNSRITKELIDPLEKTVNGTQYRLERDLGLFSRSYSKLIAVNDSGETVLYDVSDSHNIIVIFSYVILVIWWTFGIRGVIRKIMTEDDDSEDDDTGNGSLS